MASPSISPRSWDATSVLTSPSVDAMLPLMQQDTTMAEVPKAPSYPTWVQSAEERHRFDLSVAVAAQALDAEPTSAAVWSAARVLYQSDIPT